MLQFLIALLLVGFRIGGGQSMSTSADFQVTNYKPDYNFGINIPFHATIKTDQPIQEVYLSFQDDSGEIRVGKMDVNSQGEARYDYNVSAHPIRPWFRIYYWYRVKLQDGTEKSSPSFYFDYEDNRFDWHSLDDQVFQVHWYEGDESFGQTILNIAHEGFNSAQQLAPLMPPSKMNVYVYSSATELQRTLEMGGQSWVAGYASPDLGVVMVSAHSGPEQKLELERQIPHELTHVLLYNLTGQGYRNLPAWYNEGMASLAEQYANPDYTRALDVARQKNSLLPIQSLCSSFPQDASGNFLAYAEAASFTRFLQKSFGRSGLDKLTANYTNGLSCEDGVRASLGTSLRELDTRWQQETLGVNIGGLVFNNLLPYLVLFGLILVVPVAASLRSFQNDRQTGREVFQEKSA